MKNIIKSIAKRILFRPRGVNLGRNSFFYFPRWIYNPHRIRVGDNCLVGKFSIIHPMSSYNGQSLNGRIVIGDNVYIGGFCQIHVMDELEIGDGAVLSEHVYVSDIFHGMELNKGLIMRQPLHSKGTVKIGANVFIGYGCSILPGVSLGDHCVVGTRSVVTHSFPAGSMIAGAPAKLIKQLNFSTGEWLPVMPAKNGEI